MTPAVWLVVVAAVGAPDVSRPAEPTGASAPSPERAQPQDSAPGPPAAAAPPAELEESIVVTGSRVRRKDLATPAPVVVLTRDQILESGRVSVGDLLQVLPEQANAMNRQWNNSGDGSVRVNLRGLGDYRTLVLLNGRRFVPGGTGANVSVDLGAIPSGAVERIEVLKDGASPMYGSDAMGGVVNVITRRAWNGTEASAYSGVSSRGDGKVVDVNVTSGRTGDAGSLLLSAGYTWQQAIWSGDRPFGRHASNYDVTGTNSPLGLIGPYGVGSSFTPAGRAHVVNGPGTPIPNATGDPRIDRYNQLVSAYPSATSFVPDAGEPLGWRPWRGDALPEYGGDEYNFAPENYLVTPNRRLSLFATGDARLGGHARGFLEASYVARESEQKLAPEPFATGFDGVVFSAQNRWNPFGVDLDVGRRLMELGHRTFSQTVDTLRIVAGLDGTLPAAAGPLSGWAWELSFTHGRTQGTEVKRGYTRTSALRAALGPSFEDASGLHCGTPATGAIPGCVPLNLFGGPGAITPDQVAGLTFEGTARGTNEMSAVLASVSGDLFPLLAAQPVGLAAGYEYRRVSGTLIPDPVTAAGDASTDGALKTTRGSQDVHEAYAELSLPILDGAPLVERLEAQAAARVFRYSGFGTDWTWKLGGRWTPLRDVTLRGTLSTAFRAPTVAELYYGQSQQFFPSNDPCAGVDDAGNPVAISPWCGAAANNGIPPGFITVNGGGNPRLKPEVARVFTAGLVLEPRFLRNFTMTVDVYGIRIENTIHPPNGVEVNACYPMSPNVAPSLCEYVSRDPVSHALTGVFETPLNAGIERMSSVDVAARYALPTSAGRFGLSLDGTWLRSYDITRADGSVLHPKGTYDFPALAALFPAWKLNAGITWAWRGLGAGASVRYLGSSKECADLTGNFGAGSTFCSFDHAFERRIRASETWDAFVRYGLGTSAGRTDLIVGVQNLLDAAPPAVYWAFWASDPSYDFTGRFLYVRLTHRL